MKLTYWKIASNEWDEMLYSIRAKTKKEAISQFKKQINPEDYIKWGEKYAIVEKIVIEYNNAFDLVDQILCESSADLYAETEYLIK